MELIQKYFPEFSSKQLQQFEKLAKLYKEWNSKINIISRKDIENLELNHILHSLAIAKLLSFKKGTSILDVGTGGGLPGIPLAIAFPNVQFLLLDSTRKKIRVVDTLVEELELKNVKTQWARAEDVSGKFDFVVSRAVASFSEFLPWVEKKISKNQQNSIPNGIISLKGGDLSQELRGIKKPKVKNISDFFQEPFFETKKIVVFAY